MAEAVKVLPREIQDIMEVREWDMRTREGVNRFRELKAKSLQHRPQQQLCYESLIPGQEELAEEIRRRWGLKNG